MTIQASRIQDLNQLPPSSGRFVLYWMQQAQRAEYNHAVEYAIEQANIQGRPILVLFALTDDYPEANLRHYTFMLEGLKETKQQLASRGIQMVVRYGDPVQVVLDLGRNASMIVCDRGYLRHQRGWRQKIAKKAACAVVQVESDAIVPIQEVSDKAEYAAYTIRRKINRQLDMYLKDLVPRIVSHSSLSIPLKGLELDNIQTVLDQLDIDRSVPAVPKFFKGGTSQAKDRFNYFVENCFERYVAHRNQPKTLDVSFMSPYLHFGQVSSLYLALKIKSCQDSLEEAKASYLEELIVRRELAMNFVYFNPAYGSLECLPNWARKTLDAHKKDTRTFVYSKSELENSQTHDIYWNAAMREMKVSGFMHNYMRMYWGKKILEWSETPEKAWETLLAINNTYFLDGRDPNSHAGVGWIFGLHDRAWFERPVFGKVRYMAASGLERKCDIKGYVSRINQMI
ncbi:deoxyribodipyrimidine photo-lyase [Desulfobacula sp.]|uniref:deoxyribodipyrimidine photo-lyase n=1 Tax=Desulfobacula sp. TaxID=2593537 RepID=UPI00260706D3|nr:deoxyribodipyrimidine photo-lyase [Desulfobacula sp.]